MSAKTRNERYRLNHPDRVKESRKNFKKSHPEKEAEYRKTRKDDPERYSRLRAQQRNSDYKKKYGITFDEFENLIKQQGGLCPIGSHPFGDYGCNSDSPCMDHDHISGKNRSVVCRDHNAALGKFHDNPAELQSAIAYLNLWGKI